MATSIIKMNRYRHDLRVYEETTIDLAKVEYIDPISLHIGNGRYYFTLYYDLPFEDGHNSTFLSYDNLFEARCVLAMLVEMVREASPGANLKNALMQTINADVDGGA